MRDDPFGIHADRIADTWLSAMLLSFVAVLFAMILYLSLQAGSDDDCGPAETSEEWRP